MTTTFYAPPSCFSGDRLVLPEDEARHAVRVLRHGPGDELVVVDGVGGRHRVRLTETDKRHAAGVIVATEREVGEPPYRLRIGLGGLKNTNRFETFAEKAVELGVSEIVPLATERTERMSLKEKRLENILVAAMKQSGRSRLPALAPMHPLGDLLADANDDVRILCHETADPAATLPRRIGEIASGTTLMVLVGPEGGFSASEVERAAAAGWTIASLGPRRLRAETAAIAAAAAIMLHATP